VLQRVVAIVVWWAALFGGAARLDWSRGWIYVNASLAGSLAIDVLVRRHNPALLESRANRLIRTPRLSASMFILGNRRYRGSGGHIV